MRHLLKLLSHPTSSSTPPNPRCGSQQPSLINLMCLDLDQLVPSLPKVLEGDSSVSNLEQRVFPALHLESSRQVQHTVLLRTPQSCPTLHHRHGSCLCTLDCDSSVHVWCPHRTALQDRILAYLAHLWYDKYFQDD